MDAKEKYQYWLENAEYDLDTAQAMLDSERWFYVAFMCEQTIEKLVKGLYVIFIDDNVPRIHNIGKLLFAFESDLSKPVPTEYFKLFDILTSFYIQGRYTSYKQKMSSLVNRQTAIEILSQTKEAFAWLRNLVN